MKELVTIISMVCIAANASIVLHLSSDSPVLVPIEVVIEPLLLSHQPFFGLISAPIADVLLEADLAVAVQVLVLLRLRDD